MVSAMFASRLNLLKIQSIPGFFEPINPGLERNEITYHSPSATEFLENPIINKTTIDNVNSTTKQLYLDDPPAPQLETNKRLLHLPIRLAHFDPILNLKHSDALLITPLTTFGCVSLSSRLGARGHIDGRTTQSHQRAVFDDVLECAFCNASLPLANLLAHANHNAKFTVELLATLAAEHAEGCRGRNGVDLMNADDAQRGVLEGTSDQKTITNALIGTLSYFSLKNFK